MLSLHSCAPAFSSCDEWGLLPSCGAQASHCAYLSCCGAQALGMQASVVVAHRFSCPETCELFPNQGSNLGPLIGRQILASGPPGKSGTEFLFYFISTDIQIHGKGGSWLLLDSADLDRDSLLLFLHLDPQHPQSAWLGKETRTSS